MPSEDTLRDAAAELRRHAATAAVLLDDVTRLATEDLWTGPVADRFESELGHQRSQLGTVKDELITTAAALERQADAIKEAREAAAAEAARLASLEDDAEAEPETSSSTSSSSTFDTRFVR